MINIGAESDKIVNSIKEDAGVWSADQLQHLLTVGRRQRAPDFDSVCKGISQRYSGNQQSIVRSALKKAYPKTGDRLPVDPINWSRFFARQDSGVYQDGARRDLLGDDRKPLPPEDKRVVSFNRALDQIGIDVLMPEVERLANSGLNNCAVLLGYRQIEDDNKAIAHIYLPQDIVTITHPTAPDDPAAIWFCALRQQSDNSTTNMWWCWTREIKEDDAGNLLGFGPWTHRRVSEDGKIQTASENYKGKLPVCFLRTSISSSGLFADPDRDISVNIDNLNVSRSNRQHIINSQAHALYIYKGTMREAKELIGGPDDVIHISEQENFDSITANADHAAVQASSTRDLQELGVSRGNSPDAYSVTPGEQQSGVSRQIANAPHDQRIAEMRPIFKRFEEQQLLPRLIEILELFAPDAPASFSGATPVLAFNKGKPYENESERQQRVLDLKLGQLIDDAEALVMLGLKDSREEALQFLESIKGIPGGRPLVGGFFEATRETTQGE